MKKLYEVQTKKRYQSAGLQFINNLLVLGVLYKNEVRLESIYLPRIECVLIFNETREGSMFPAENIQRQKKPSFIRYLFLFNLLLLPLFMVVARTLWGQDLFSVSPTGVLFWPGAVTHVLLLGGVWLFLDVLFMIWFYISNKKS
ncbi:TPA: hypothetical protein ACNP9N_000297 [Enterobacter asburiae]|uniref:hypothetical protein n=1 Tax=Enterobacter asburiae TaxID=61645 RepID=UPI0007C831CE|nr:hypothetical protein [Enterobacter asburiae]MCB4614599.1 hypothetical protein [Enterobacter asburiae]MCU3444246.1 hypothetical protein [Enterobacter asburiae]MEB2408269.1 hypothetical protein [Enterobacter asburiae]HAT7490608.1 hypothetical protein [Enterobacter asburiae]HAT7511649.1 hypothetical protein [Enterobacter asburiae]